MSGHFHHGGIDDVYVYEHDFDDVDLDHADTAHLEHDLYLDDGRYEHIGTFDFDSGTYDEYVASLIGTAAVINVAIHPEQRLLVVHRRG